MNCNCKDCPIACMTDTPATIEANNFIFKSLSEWALNFFIGCLHACRFCYVTDTSIRKIAKLIRSYGVEDPVRDWGKYILLRPWDRQQFLASLRKAEETPPDKLKPDGNRAVMLCTTTDAFQVIRHPDTKMQKLLREHARHMRRESLTLTRDESTVNVRVLTRGLSAEEDFPLFKSFGDRLLFGTSLPTLDPQLASVYEPKVPAPKRRLKLLLDAREAGINTFVAVAPVFPECDYEGLVKLFKEVKKADPVTIFVEPVNLRLDIARRIEEEAARVGRTIDMMPYTDDVAWADYAIGKLREAERAAAEAGVADRLHLWPDKALGSKKVVDRQPDPEAYRNWLNRWWGRISEWPGAKAQHAQLNP
jgi:DNA repair photolyase